MPSSKVCIKMTTQSTGLTYFLLNGAPFILIWTVIKQMIKSCIKQSRVMQRTKDLYIYAYDSNNNVFRNRTLHNENKQILKKNG